MEFELDLERILFIQFAETRAHDVSRRYHGFPVYLVGGALRDADPRDIDLVIILPDATFKYAYGTYDDWIVGRVWPNTTWLKWARDCAKMSESLSEDFRRFVDFRTQHEKTAEHYKDLPRLRLSAEIVRGR